MPDIYNSDPVSGLVDILGSSEIAPLLWRSDREDVESAWFGHVPFAHWLVTAASPRCIVELGTHAGVSYAAFCRAVQRAGLATQCYAVDTWLGDDHAGHYPSNTFDGLRAYHDQHFAAFSTLLRCRFDEALALIPDGSIDLLHIDGRHGYDDVRHDYQSWVPKLSSRGIVLLHDTHERRPGFGVWQFWCELKACFPHFEFLHAHGLGVLAVGTEIPPGLAVLLGLRDSATIGAIRECFGQLGERGALAAQVRLLAQAGEEQRRQAAAMAAALDTTQAGRDRDAAQAREDQRHQALATAAALDAAEARHDHDAAKVRQDALDASQAACDALAEVRTELAALAASLDLAQQGAAGWEAAKAAAERREAAARLALAATERDLRLQRNLVAQAVADRDDARMEATRAHGRWAGEADRRATAEAALAGVVASGTWRVTGPLRSVLRHMPARGRKAAFNGLRWAWMVMTPHLDPLRQKPDAAVPEAPTVAVMAAVPAPVADICYVSGEPHTPGSRYRVDRFATAFVAIGARVNIIGVADLDAGGAVAAARCSVAVLWRVAWSPAVAAFTTAARAAGARIIFDVDDLMIDPALATNAIIDGIRSQNLTEHQVREHFTAVQQTMLQADFCFASTDELAGHLRRFGKPAMTLPNGFDEQTLAASRMAARQRALLPDDGLLRIGYAGGSRTHQRDFGVVAGALAAVLRRHPNCRLVLFRAPDGAGLIRLDEYPGLEALASQVEWRDMVDLSGLPAELARFDVNLAPLETGNLFCEAKSELKYFEAALAGVCTVASPTGPYRRAIRHGRTGLLARTPAEWEAALDDLLASPERRRAMARHALMDVLWQYGPERRVQAMRRLRVEWAGGPAAADAFAIEAALERDSVAPWPDIPECDPVFVTDRLRPSSVTVVVPLFNYAQIVEETLDSVCAQTLEDLDLVVVDDASTDNGLGVALAWMQRHAGRFNRAVLLRNRVNAGLSASRNAGFLHAETPWVLPLDADNRLRPACCEVLLDTARRSGAAFAFPVIQEFGQRTGLMGTQPYDPRRLVGGNYIDAMALIARSAWAAVRGYAPMRDGWEDYEFWCAMAAAGQKGMGVGGEPLAEYRAHDRSMLARVTDVVATKENVIATLERRHPWVHVARPLP